MRPLATSLRPSQPRTCTNSASLLWEPTSSRGSGPRKTKRVMRWRISKSGGRLTTMLAPRGSVASLENSYNAIKLVGTCSTHQTKNTVPELSPMKSNSMRAVISKHPGIACGSRGWQTLLLHRAASTPLPSSSLNARYGVKTISSFLD